jgi:hypothetical protein
MRISNCNTDCIWTYKCCEFKEVNGAVKSARMCEAQINCEGNNNNDDAETFDEIKSERKSENFLFSKKFPIPMCNRGYKYVNGKCRQTFAIENSLNSDPK